MGTSPPRVPSDFFFNNLDVSSVPCADLLSTSSVDVMVQWIGGAGEQAQYVQITSMELYNFSQPTQPFIPNLAIAAVDALSAYQHQTFGVYDAASANTTPLNDFDNFIQDPDIIRAEISLNAPPENVNEWYSSTMIRKFGVFLWDVDIQQTPMEFINRQVSVFLSPQAQQMKGCLVNLQKNCKGEITTYKAAQRLTTLVSIDGGVTYKPWAMGGTFGTPQFPS